MKRINSLLISIVLFTVIFVISCKKETTYDPNQPLIDQMKSVTDSIIKNTHVPGVVALVVDHKLGINWMYTAGVSDIPNKLPMNGNYIFRIGSNTKTMTCTVLLQLVGERKIALNDKLSKYFHGYPKSDSITISMLANMTSGIYSYTMDESWWNALIANPTKFLSPLDLVNAGFAHEFDFQPGAGWAYSNTNTIILGQIIEKITGNTLETEISNRIVKPLKLSSTGFQTSGLTFPGPHARGYYFGEYVEGKDYTETFDISWGWAAGSAYSTPRELQKYVEALVGGGLLPDSLQNRRLNDMINIRANTSYGLGLARRGTFYGHNGSLMGYTSSMYHSNERDCTIIIYFNSMLEIVPDFLFFRYANILYGNNY